MNISGDELAYVRSIRQRYAEALLRKANVVGVGIGIQEPDEDEERAPRVVLVVSVTHKVKHKYLHWKDVIPSRVEDVPVRVEAIGHLQAQDD
ncbi:MAG: hypothetical protein U9Q70_12205 [Chloroflexota bacterium]|nr:hypothetical protein [Chloroflexota bacterium]